MFGLGSSSQLGIGIAISLNNKFSGQASKVHNDLLAIKQSSKSLAASAVNDYRNTAAAISAGAAGVSYGMFRYAEQHSEFQHRINQVYVVGGKELGKSRKELEQFAREFSRTFAKNPTDIASALFENVKAGVTTGLEEVTKYQVAVATATDEMLGGEEGVAAKLLGITNAMGLSMDQFARVANATTAAANASMANVRGIGESMEYAAFTAHRFNIPLEKVLAMVAKLSQSKITGSAAGTALNNFLVQLSKNAGIFKGKKAEAVWQMLGVDPNEVTSILNTGDIFGVADLLDNALQKLPNDKRIVASQQLFNLRGDRGLAALVESMGSGDPTKTFRGLYQATMAGVQSDLVMKQAKAMQQDVYSDIKFLRNSLYEVGISFVKAVTPIARIILPLMSKGLQLFASFVESPIGIVLTSITAIAAPLVALKFGFRALNLSVAMLLKTLGNTGAIGGYSALSGAAWNMAAGGLMNYGRSQLPAGLNINRRGGLYVGAGQTYSIGNKTYTAGQAIPAPLAIPGYNQTMLRGQALGSLLTGAGSMASAAGTAGAAASATGLVGRLASSPIGKFAMAGLRYLPMIGVLYSIYEIIKLLWGDTKKEEDKPKDPILDAMRKNDYFEMMYGNLTKPGFSQFQKAFEEKYGRKPFTIILNNNIDGVNTNSQRIDALMDQSISRDLNTSLMGY